MPNQAFSYNALTYKIPVSIAPSQTDGLGVFTKQAVPKGYIVWIFTPGHDTIVTLDEYENIEKDRRIVIDRTGYLSPVSNTYIVPPSKDPAQYTNHSAKNNLTAIFDEKISPEPYFVANRNIDAGEELTNNYNEFDRVTQQTKPNWAK